MLRLCNAELYKLRKSKSFYIFIIVTVVFVAIMYSTISLVSSSLQGMADSGMPNVIKDRLQTTGSIWNNVHLMDFMQEIFSGDAIACMISIFTSIFVIREYASGMMKNIVGKGCSRGSIYLAKLLTAILASLLIALAGIAAVLVIGRIFIGADAFAGNFGKNLPVYAALQLIMTGTLAAIFVMIGELCRNLAAGISIGIGVAAFPAMILNVIDLQFAEQNITLSQYWPVTRMTSCPFEGFTTGYLIKTLVVSVVWMGITTGVGMWHFYHTDIK